MALELQAPGGRRGEVVLTRADVRPAVDHRHAHDAAVVAQGDLRAARQRLVGDAELPASEACRRSSGRPAVEAGAVPRRVAPSGTRSAARGRRLPAGPRADACTRARALIGLALTVAQHVRAARVGAIPVERHPARRCARTCSATVEPAGWIRPRTTARRPVRTFMRRSDTATFEAVAVGVVPWVSCADAARGHGRRAGICETERAAGQRSTPIELGPQNEVLLRLSCASDQAPVGDGRRHSGRGSATCPPPGWASCPAGSAVERPFDSSERRLRRLRSANAGHSCRSFAQAEPDAGSWRCRAGPARGRRSRPAVRPPQ